MPTAVESPEKGAAKEGLRQEAVAEQEVLQPPREETPQELRERAFAMLEKKLADLFKRPVLCTEETLQAQIRGFARRYLDILIVQGPFEEKIFHAVDGYEGQGDETLIPPEVLFQRRLRAEHVIRIDAHQVEINEQAQQTFERQPQFLERYIVEYINKSTDYLPFDPQEESHRREAAKMLTGSIIRCAIETKDELQIFGDVKNSFDTGREYRSLVSTQRNLADLQKRREGEERAASSTSQRIPD